MRSSGITVYTETSSDFIPSILHEEIQGILPVLILHSEDKELFDSFYIQKTRSSLIHSTYRRQGDLLSRPTRHSRHSSRKTLHRHSSSTRTFQTFQSFMTFQPYKHFQHFFNQNANSTPDWFPPETPLSASRIQDILQTLHSSKKGRCCDIGHTLTYSPE